MLLDITFDVLCLALSTGLAYYFVPILRRAALTWGVVDKPDGRLKRQTAPVPYLGGLAIYLAFLVTLSLLYVFEPRTVGLLFAATLILLVGLIDDFGVLTPAQKFIGQILATFVMVKAGIQIQVESFPTWLSLACTFVWMLGMTNAVNLLDISDGLAGATSAAAALVLFIIATLNGHAMIAIVALALFGSVLGFLAFNWSPASIYMGDTGSLFLGFVLGALAMMADYSDTNPVAYVAPLLILGVPIFDTAFVMLVRLRKGLPVWLGSPDHIALRLKRRGYGPARIASLFAAATLLLGGAALVMMQLDPLPSLVLFGACLVVELGVGVWLYRLETP